MGRDLAVWVTTALLAALAAATTGLVPGVRLPATAALDLGLFVVAFVAFAVLPWLATSHVERVGRVAAVVVAAVPFLVLGLLEAPRAPGTILVPAPAWGLALGASVVLALLPPTLARRLAGVLLVLLALGAVLDAGPRRTVLALGSPAVARAPAPVEGLWPGAPTPVVSPPLGAGEGPWFVPAAEGSLPGGPPRVLLVDGPVGAEPLVEDGALYLPLESLPASPGIALSGADAALVLPGAWHEGDPAASRLADGLAAFTARGGLLLGPAPGRAWPPGLARRLGPAAAAPTAGLAGRRPFGLGSVVRVDGRARIREVLAAGAWRPAVTTVFDREPSRWRALANRLLPPPRPVDRRPQGALLLGYGLVIGLLDQVLRHGPLRILGLLAPALAAVAGLIWTSPGLPPPRIGGVALDLGGAGGRRVEALVLEAGERGWRGAVAWRGGGLLRQDGAAFDAEGRLVVDPGRRVWLVRERVARGGFRGERETPQGAAARAFVRGPVEAARLRIGRIDRLDVDVAGRVAVPACTLVWPGGGG